MNRETTFPSSLHRQDIRMVATVTDSSCPRTAKSSDLSGLSADEGALSFLPSTLH